MGIFGNLVPEELEVLNQAYAWMEEEREAKGEEVTSTSYSTIVDYYADFDMHVSFFYDSRRDKLFARTFFYASGAVTYEEIENADTIVNESDESRAIAWMLLRTGVFLEK